ncbi:MAG TPA: hypothetical protein VK590_03920 [Saprospiraceae bacterium]|nr:hypothetical protein [Saprospiraceae bacterium]
MYSIYRTNIIFFALLLIFSIGTFTQCSKEATHGPNADIMVNNIPFSDLLTYEAAFEEKTLFIEVVGKKGYESIIIQVLGFKGDGIYNLEKPNVEVQDNIMIYKSSPNNIDLAWNWVNPAGPGYIEVTHFDPSGTISANFNCVLYDNDNPGTLFQINGKVIDLQLKKTLPDGFNSFYASADIDGSDFIGYASGTIDGDFLLLRGIEGGSRQVNILFQTNINPGTYDLKSSNLFSLGYLDTNLPANDPAEIGILTILSNDLDKKRIRGKFEFTTKGGHHITGGEFYGGYE